MRPPSDAPSPSFDAEARLSVFGFPPGVATVRLRPRSRRWRLVGALRAQALGLVAAPLMALLPPHIPWAMGAVGVGFFLARRRWTHRVTLESVHGTCPRCQAALAVQPGALKDPHRIPCEGCHHEVALTLVASPPTGPGAASA